MIELRPFEKLGKSDHGWLNANFHPLFAFISRVIDAVLGGFEAVLLAMAEA